MEAVFKFLRKNHKGGRVENIPPPWSRDKVKDFQVVIKA